MLNNSPGGDTVNVFKIILMLLIDAHCSLSNGSHRNPDTIRAYLVYKTRCVLGTRGEYKTGCVLGTRGEYKTGCVLGTRGEYKTGCVLGTRGK